MNILNILLYISFFVLFVFILIKLYKYKSKNINKIMLNNLRYFKLKKFIFLATGILNDTSLIKEDDFDNNYQLYALTPLLKDILKYGEKLLEQRKRYHIVLYYFWEVKLDLFVLQLHNRERLLNQIPKPSLDVLWSQYESS